MHCIAVGRREGIVLRYYPEDNTIQGVQRFGTYIILRGLLVKEGVSIHEK
jgi:hypothetical protein